MIEVIGSKIGNAAGLPGCEDAPEVIRDIASGVMNLNWSMIESELHETKHLDSFDAVVRFSENLAQRSFELTHFKKPFINVGGDHSCAIGMWSGVASAVQEEIGLVWVDAHMDAHTFDTSPTGNIHGMPVAALLGHGEKALTQILTSHPKLRPENICLVGIRSYEDGEAILLRELGVRIMYIEEVFERGIAACMQAAFDIASKAKGGFGLSVDVDGFDIDDAPAVGTPAGRGIRFQEFLPCVASLASNPHFLALEVVEYNPSLDKGNLKTQQVVLNLMQKVFA